MLPSPPPSIKREDGERERGIIIVVINKRDEIFSRLQKVEYVAHAYF